MNARFLHVADCHLGYRQYNNTERYNDFARAFRSIIRTAIAEAVDFVVLAGDLFDKRTIDAFTLNQATVILEQLKAANIPCIAVEGNHEKPYLQDHIGWVRFLAERELLILLDPFRGGKMVVAPYEKRTGAYIDIRPGLRVYGLGYSGSGTPKAVEVYAETLRGIPRDQIEYTIFIAHAGVEGVVDDKGGLSHRQWSVLRPYVDYLALGHIHKPYHFDDWIYNPGSPETCSMTEVEWADRGYYLVEVDTKRARADGEPKHVATRHANPRRPFHRVSIKVDLYSTPEELYAYCRTFLVRKARDLGVGRRDGMSPVVELALTGVLPFDRSALDIGFLESLLQETFDPLHAQVRNLTRTAGFAVDVEESLTRSDLERQVLGSLLERDTRFRTHSERWAQLVLSLKDLAINGSAPDAIIRELADHLSAREAE